MINLTNIHHEDHKKQLNLKKTYINALKNGELYIVTTISLEISSNTQVPCFFTPYDIVSMMENIVMVTYNKVKPKYVRCELTSIQQNKKNEYFGSVFSLYGNVCNQENTLSNIINILKYK